MANEPKVKVAEGFRQEFVATTPIVLCWTCKRTWRIPEAMYRTGSLSPNAWRLLQEHREAHRPQRQKRSERIKRALPNLGNYDEVS